MKAIQIEAPNRLRIIEQPMPEVDDHNNVLVKVVSAGICGSDVGIYHGTNAAATYPRVIGHEVVGIVEKTTPTATKVKVGDRVIIDEVTYCGECYACRHGRPNVCGNLKVRGVHIDGGYREYVAVPDTDCYLVPEGLSDEDAIMIEPTTISLQAVGRAEIQPDDMVLVIGAGALGTSVLKMILAAKPEKLLVADIDDVKLAEALELGADGVINSHAVDLKSAVRELTGGYGPTVVFDAACVKGSLFQAMDVAGNAARVISMGFSAAPDEYNVFVITSKELDVRGSRLHAKKFQEAVDLIEAGRIDLNGSCSHTFPFEKAQEAFDFMDSHDPSIRKIVLKF